MRCFPSLLEFDVCRSNSPSSIDTLIDFVDFSYGNWKLTDSSNLRHYATFVKLLLERKSEHPACETVKTPHSCVRLNLESLDAVPFILVEKGRAARFQEIDKNCSSYVPFL